MKRALGDKTAFNEAMFGRLGRRLQLSVPEIVALDVPSDLIEDDVELSAVQYPPALHVGIVRLSNGSFDLKTRDVATVLKGFRIENESGLPGTCVYSRWVEDWDHWDNDGNWMVEPGERSTATLWMIDFGHALGGNAWTIAQLQKGSNVQALADGPPSHPIVEAACRKHGFDGALKQVQGVAPQELRDLVGSVPPKWIQPAEREAVVQFLLARRPGLPRVLDEEEL